MLDIDGDFAIFMLDATGRIETWNPAAERITGYSAAEIVGKPLSALHFPEPQGTPPLDELLFHVASVGHARYEGWHTRRDGTRFWANVIISAQQRKQGDLAGFAAVALDASERHLYEQKLRQSEERLRLMIDSVRDYAIFMLSPSGEVTSWNSGAQAIKGYVAEEVLGRHFSVFYTPEDQAAGLPQQLLSAAAVNDRVQAEGWRVRRDGSRFWADVMISAIRDESGTLRGFTKVTRDLTERRRFEELERISEVAAAAERARESEKARIARELHDDLGQQLTALKMYAAELEHATAEGRSTPEMASRARTLASQIDGMMVAVRRIAADLRPTLLDDLGLLPAIEWLADDFGRRYKVKTRIQSSVGAIEFNETAATAIYRIVQEALTNVARHAQATEVSINIEVAEGHCVVGISDDGIGAPSGLAREKAFGFLGIRERVRQLGGTVTFENGKNGGFCVQAEWPAEAVARL